MSQALIERLVQCVEVDLGGEQRAAVGAAREARAVPGGGAVRRAHPRRHHRPGEERRLPAVSGFVLSTPMDSE